MGGFIGFSDTQFVGTEEMGAVSSYQPCIVFGDSMLIGMGIRVGFYLLYWAAIIAVIFGIDQQFRIWNASWAIAALATFISLVANSSPQTLMVLAWAILIELVLFYPVFFFFQVFLRTTYAVAESQHSATVDDIRARLSLRRAVTRLDAARARRYADVLKAFALHAAAVQKEGQYEAAQAARLTESIEVFTTHWSEHDAVIGGRHRTMEELSAEGDTTAVIYHPTLLAEKADAPTRQDVEAFRDLYIASLVKAEMSAEEAQAMELEVAAIAAEELQIRRRTMKPKHAAKYMLYGTGVKDKVAAALGLLVWSVWIYATPFLWFKLRYYGFKDECHGYVNLYVLFKPLDPWWDYGFGIFLKIFAIASIPVAVIVTIVALWLLYLSIFGQRNIFKAGRARKGHRRTDEEADQVEDVTVDVVQNKYARRRHSEEVLATIHDRQTRGRAHRYRRRSPPPLHFSLFNIPWVIILLILQVYTIATVELTIRQNPGSGFAVFFVRPNLHETGEILVFLIGLFVLILVIWTIFEALAHMLLRKRWRTAEHHHHGQRKGDVGPKRGSQEELWKRREAESHPEH